MSLEIIRGAIAIGCLGYIFYLLYLFWSGFLKPVKPNKLTVAKSVLRHLINSWDAQARRHDNDYDRGICLVFAQCRDQLIALLENLKRR